MITIVYIIFGIAFLLIILSFVFMFSSKARGKILSKQVESLKYMMDESKDDIENISTNMADATKDGVETTVRAIKKGITEDDEIYCKYCGSKIDKDSKYCKKCGKEQ